MRGKARKLCPTLGCRALLVVVRSDYFPSMGTVWWVGMGIVRDLDGIS